MYFFYKIFSLVIEKKLFRCNNYTETDCNQELSYTVSTKGYTASTKGYTVSTKGYTVSTKGYTVSTKGYTVSTKGYTVSTKSYTVSTKGYTVSTKGYILSAQKVILSAHKIQLCSPGVCRQSFQGRCMHREGLHVVRGTHCSAAWLPCPDDVIIEVLPSVGPQNSLLS